MTTVTIHRPLPTDVVAAAINRVVVVGSRARTHDWRGMFLQLVRFAGVGSLGMGLYVGLFVLGQQVTTGPVANVGAWLISTLATNRAHRSLTFGVHERKGAALDQTISLVTSVIALLASTLVLAAFPGTGTVESIAILVAVNVVVGLARFATMRWWIVGHRVLATA